VKLLRDRFHALVRASVADLGLAGNARVRDLWLRRGLDSFGPEFAPFILAHGAGLYRLAAPSPARERSE